MRKKQMLFTAPRNFALPLTRRESHIPPPTPIQGHKATSRPGYSNECAYHQTAQLDADKSGKTGQVVY